jgi:hypothetical protein
MKENVETLRSLMARYRSLRGNDRPVTTHDAWRKIGQQYTSPLDAEKAQKYAAQYPDIHQQCLAGAIRQAKEYVEGAQEAARTRFSEKYAAEIRSGEVAFGNTDFPDTVPGDQFDE